MWYYIWQVNLIDWLWSTVCGLYWGYFAILRTHVSNCQNTFCGLLTSDISFFLCPIFILKIPLPASLCFLPLFTSFFSLLICFPVLPCPNVLHLYLNSPFYTENAQYHHNKDLSLFVYSCWTTQQRRNTTPLLFQIASQLLVVAHRQKCQSDITALSSRSSTVTYPFIQMVIFGAVTPPHQPHPFSTLTFTQTARCNRAATGPHKTGYCLTSHTVCSFCIFDPAFAWRFQ